MHNQLFFALKNITLKSSSLLAQSNFKYYFNNFFLILMLIFRLIVPKRLLGEVLTSNTNLSKKAIGGWLLGCAGMVYGAVALGGLTRFYNYSMYYANYVIK